MSATDTFEQQVDKTTQPPCWLWVGAKPNAYGWAGDESAHRKAWRLYRGQIPKGLFVLHKCDNKPCVRPHHLYLGTREDNAADAVLRGKMATGDRNGARKHPERLARGDNNGAVKTIKPYCRRGHPWTAENTRYDKLYSKARYCLTCKNDAQRRRRANGVS